MTNEEATKILNVFIELLESSGGRNLFIWDWYTAKDNYLEALNTAIEALKAEPCEDAVSREAVGAVLDWHEHEKSEIESYIWDIAEDIKALPPVTPKQRTGKWIEKDEWNDTVNGFEEWGYFHECSKCGYVFKFLEIDNFCPNCGAKMEGVSE